MKTYCYDCGAKLEFSPKDKPKFCAKCGVSLSGVKEKKLEAAASTEGEEEDAVSIPSISGLDFDFVRDAETNKKMTLGSIMGTLDPDQMQGRAPLGAGITQEQAMEQFKKEAGSIRQGSKKKDAQT